MYYKDGSGFTSLMSQMNSFIGKEKCFSILEESVDNTRQRKLFPNSDFESVVVAVKESSGRSTSPSPLYNFFFHHFCNG